MQIYHIVWVTHNSRISTRMIEYEAVIRRRRIDKGLQPLAKPTWLEDWQEIEITEDLMRIVLEDNIKVSGYNICGDHIHIIITCPKEQRSNIVRKLKGKTTQYYKWRHNIAEELHLWAQKYCLTLIESKNQLNNTRSYIRNNRQKHELPENKQLETAIEKLVNSKNSPWKANKG